MCVCVFCWGKRGAGRYTCACMCVLIVIYPHISFVKEFLERVADHHPKPVTIVTTWWMIAGRMAASENVLLQ